MVPVLSKNKETLMPCSEKRARLLMERKQAKSYYQKGVFCIILLKSPSDDKKQPIYLGIDPGSKREGYTVTTKKNVVLNITTNTPYWVKGKIEFRKAMRKTRRSRKTPYRKCRRNRASLKNLGLPPSTKSRWDAKLRIVKFLSGIIPITDIILEDINAITLKGKRKWNVSFSPLQVGKKYFEKAITNMKFNLVKFQGYETFEHRSKRQFKKLTGKRKLDFTWESHCVDSHSLVEMFLKKEIKSFYSIWKIEFLNFFRRQLRLANTKKDNVTQSYGTTVSLGMRRGSVVKYKDKLVYLGGSSKNTVAVHSIITGKRVNQYVKKEGVKMVCNNSWRAQFLPRASS